ncbi:MAG: methyltransferase [Candidatus Schekmanbacteria bacterium]|nr:methyltransferase [Candidatus Schekmanbacteria bacterium]
MNAAEYPPDSTIRARLEALRQPDEVVTPIVPDALAGGDWWPTARAWPRALAAGVLEPRRGYRFRPENVGVAHLLQGMSAGTVMDLGAGSGSLLLLAGYLTCARRLVGIELQADAVDRLRRTLLAHGLDGTVVCGDARSPEVRCGAAAAAEGKAQMVLLNPPFFPEGWGRPSNNPSTHLSTHATHGGVGELLAATAALLAPGGHVLVVYDAARLAELLVAAAALQLGLERLAWIPDQRPGRAAQPFRVWADFMAGQGLVATRLSAGHPLPGLTGDPEAASRGSDDSAPGSSAQAPSAARRREQSAGAPRPPQA